ncbi:MAG: DUF6516 family protein [Anaerolineae bacterium]|nr:DUF6516 family protein [Anaerolineae bacterium]
MLFALLQRLRDIALSEFSDIVERAQLIYSPVGRVRKLRIHILDGSFVDVWLSLRGDYAFHWERRPIDGTIYRHDNAPHQRWRHIGTFPQHFHDETEDNVRNSDISLQPDTALREFLAFVRTKL